MPRKTTSTGELTSNRKTSEIRAMEKKHLNRKHATEVADGGKWAGSGEKTVEHGQGPAIARQAEHGRGPKTRTVHRTAAH